MFWTSSTLTDKLCGFFPHKLTNPYSITCIFMVCDVIEKCDYSNKQLKQILICIFHLFRYFQLKSLLQGS